jgi:pimeloyl-ACP methyl ester carboxylesterase
MAESERIVVVNGVELCMEGFGDASDPAILLAHGASDSMLSWREEFCERLAAGGRYVVRYDNRDAGRSTSFDVGAPPYAQRDEVADAAALIEALGLGRVHFAGLSGGGVIAQLLALEHPERVATLTLLATTPADPGTEDFDLPGPDKRLDGVFTNEREPDWTDRDAVIEYLVELERPFAGSGGFDAEAQRELCGRVFDRTRSIAAQMTNPFKVESEPWRKRLPNIEAPTLVIHGADDPLFPLEHGRALAREIPDAELLVLDGVGHEYPPPRVWETVVVALLRHTDTQR